VRHSLKDLKQHYDEICKSVPTEYGSKCYGYHKECYSKFTNLKYLKAIKWKSDQDPEVELSIKKKKSNLSITFTCDFCLFVKILQN